MTRLLPVPISWEGLIRTCEVTPRRLLFEIDESTTLAFVWGSERRMPVCAFSQSVQRVTEVEEPDWTSRPVGGRLMRIGKNQASVLKAVC